MPRYGQPCVRRSPGAEQGQLAGRVARVFAGSQASQGRQHHPQRGEEDAEASLAVSFFVVCNFFFAVTFFCVRA